MSIIISVFGTGEEKHWRDSRVRSSLSSYLMIHRMLSSSSTSKHSLSLYGLTFFRYFSSLKREAEWERETRLKDLFTWTTSTTTCLLHQYLMKKKRSQIRPQEEEAFVQRQEDYSRIKAAGDIYVTTSTFMSFVTIRKSKSKRSPTGFMLRDLLVLSKDFASRWKRMKLLSLFFFPFFSRISFCLWSRITET